MQLSDIHIRDPFVFPSPTEGLYYLFGTNCDGSWGPREKGFQYFTSPDLAEWAGPFPAFTPPANFWADRDFWAPEVHAYRGRFYLFGSLKAEGVRRGTQILAADRVGGPYVPLSAGPVTPAEWNAWTARCMSMTTAHHGWSSATNGYRWATGKSARCR